jgi:acetyl esterase/lipase
MSLNLGCRVAGYEDKAGDRSRRYRRASQAFRPQPVTGLEERALLSTHAAPTAARHDQQAALPPPWTEIQNVAFATVDGQTELLDVYTPVGPAPAGGFPVMVAIHGGGWRSSDKSTFGLRTAEGFVPDGYVVVAPDYALSAPGSPTWPVNLEDVQAAVRWVRTNAGVQDFNSDEIVAEGESAGANLAALVGVYSTQSDVGGVSAAVEAVVAVSTPANLTQLWHEKRYAGTAAAQFLGGTPHKVPGNFIAASPIDHVSTGDPPMLLIHGRQDPIIPVSQSAELQGALTAAGVRNQLLLVTGGHGLDFPAHYSDLIPDVLEFLDATWKD